MTLSRREFLGGAAALAGAAALPSVMVAAPAVAADALPLSTVEPWKPLDPKLCARLGWEVYKGQYTHMGQSACCEATYWGIVGYLSESYPDNWGRLPRGLFNYGGGGVNAWGIICGTPNGGTAVLTQLGAPKAVKDNYLRWYEKSSLPTNAAYDDYKSGTWTPGGKSGGVWGGTGCPIPWNGLPRSAAESTLCHVSLTKWRTAADKYQLTKSPTLDLQSNRCGALVYDSTYYLATLINKWKAGEAIDGALSPAASASGCRASLCHGSVPTDPTCDAVTAQGVMNCKPCHTGL